MHTTYVLILGALEGNVAAHISVMFEYCKILSIEFIQETENGYS